MPSKILAHSHSAMEQFETCPKQYYEERIAKNIKFEENEHTIYGKKAHDALEKYVIHDVELPLGMAQYRKQALPFKMANGDKYGEQKLAIDRDFEPCDWFDKKTYFRAIIDLLIVNGKNAVLIDWKTGKKKEGFAQLQLAAALLLTHQPTIERVDCAFIWLREKDVTQCRVYKDDLSDIWEDILPAAKRIQLAYEKQNFPAKPSGLCKKWCRATRCQYHGVGA